MIFPDQCKWVGHAIPGPISDRIYFLSRYLLRETPDGYEVLQVTPDPSGTGMMRRILRAELLAGPEEVCLFPEKVNLNDRTRLVRLALETGYRCTIFTGLDEHKTFVLDPDLSRFLGIHVYDAIPPRPSLSACIAELESTGLFGELAVLFHHHIQDISKVSADVYPCRAAGFSRTLDADPMHGGELVAGCLTGSQFYNECYGSNFTLQNICPLEHVREEPFIARCCRSEREGIRTWNGKFGAVVHWGASPAQIASRVAEVAEQWRKK